MLRGSRGRDALLDGLFGASALGALLSGAHYSETSPPWMSALLLLSVAVCICLWGVMRRAARLGPVVGAAFALFGAVSWFLANSTLGLGMLWIAAIVLVRSLGMTAVLVYTALTVCLGTGLHVVIGSSPGQILIEAVGATFFAAFGGLFALLLHASDRAEAALQRANTELSEQAGMEQDLVLAQERERTARGLHDVLGHRLTAVGLSLEFAEQMRERDPERAWQEVRLARSTAGDALDDMRRLVRAMHPLESESAAGAEAFTAIADVFRASGIDIRVRAAGPLAELPREQRLLLVRFVQEGLTNVVRHSGAGRVDVAVTAEGRRVEAVIQDDGRAHGIESAEPGLVAEGFGLRSLRERSEALGGALDVRSDRSGFRLRVLLPLHGEQKGRRGAGASGRPERVGA